MYLHVFYIYIYKRNTFFSFRVRLRNACGERTAWRDKALHMIAAIWDVHGRIWHGKFQSNFYKNHWTFKLSY